MAEVFWTGDPDHSPRPWHEKTYSTPFSWLSSVTVVALALALLLLPDVTQAQAPPPNAQMKAVLDELTVLGGKPIPELSAEDARKQPTSTDAVKALMKKQGKTDPQAMGAWMDIIIKLTSGSLAARVYTPKG